MSEVAYSVAAPYPEYRVRGRAQTASLALYRDGAVVAPTASGSTFAFYGPAGEVVIAPTPVTVASSVATYPILATELPSTLSLGRGYYEIWHLILPDGTRRDYRRDVSLVLYAVYPVVSDTDILAVYSDLNRQRASGVSTFQGAIDEAWRRILGRLEGQGVFPEHIVTDWSLREVHLELTLHLLCLDYARAQGGRWGELAERHKKEFELAWARLRFVKATADSAAPDGDDLRSANKGVTLMNASPSTRWRGSWGI